MGLVFPDSDGPRLVANVNKLHLFTVTKWGSIGMAIAMAASDSSGNRASVLVDSSGSPVKVVANVAHVVRLHFNGIGSIAMAYALAMPNS